jgi:heme A synthase
LILTLLTIVQVTLGALTIITARNPWINSVHVVCGALVLTTSLVITLRSWRAKFAVRGTDAPPSAAHAMPPPTTRPAQPEHRIGARA